MRQNKKFVILVPYPAQGHVSPMLKLAAVLSNLSLRPVIVTPEFIHRRISPRIAAGDGILCLSVPDGGDSAPRDFFAIERAMEEDLPPALERILREKAGEIACLVADLLVSPAVEVARRCGVTAAGFWPAMHATYRLIASIPQLIQSGIISEDGCPIISNASITFMSPNDPILSTNDLPWLVGSLSSRISRFRFWTRTLQRCKSLKWILTNTFPNECQSNHNVTRVLEIGPLIMQATTINNVTSCEEDADCLSWLDEHNTTSVMYVSFGSWVNPISESKIKTLALTLETLDMPFIWVLGQTWRRGLPLGYIERVAKLGRIVSWAPQMEVLRHPAIGCYLTHCGWNSTMEAILCKKPLLCYPIAGDQFTNSRYIVSIWRIGIKLDGFEFETVKDGIARIVRDIEVSYRIETLNQKIFGKEGNSRAVDDLSIFIEDLNAI